MSGFKWGSGFRRDWIREEENGVVENIAIVLPLMVGGTWVRAGW